MGALGAVVVSRFGEKAGLLDLPGHRSSHSIPTPKGGGIGIVVAFVLVAVYVEMPMVFWLPGAIVALQGLYGDRIHLSPRNRLIVQFAAATVLIAGMTFGRTVPLLWLALLLLWAVYIVGTANFYNFMDGINGLGGVTSFVAFGLLAVYLFSIGDNSLPARIATGLALSCLGFIPFNMPRATVFLGDAGSIFLGFVFASLVFVLSSCFLDFICFAALLFPFYIDELTTMVVRIRKGENLTLSHRRHLYQLFANEKGTAHWKITLCYSVMQLFVGAGALFIKPAGTMAVLLFLGLSSLLFILVGYRVRKGVGVRIKI